MLFTGFIAPRARRRIATTAAARSGIHENGCYVPCDEAEAEGFCIKTAIDRKDEETGATTTYLEDFVYAFADGGLLGIEPVGSVENVSGTLMLAENDKVLDILLGGAAE